MWPMHGKHTKGHTEKPRNRIRTGNYPVIRREHDEVMEILRPSDTFLDEIIAEVKSWDD